MPLKAAQDKDMSMLIPNNTLPSSPSLTKKPANKWAIIAGFSILLGVNQFCG